MYRRMIPLAVMLVVALGCGKKKDTAPAPDGDGDPNATYTIKLRPAAQGDKYEVNASENMTIELGGKGEKMPTQKTREYTETITELPAGAKQPTKLTRTYKVAKGTDFISKQLKSTAFEGKTVSAEKKGEEYEATIDGKKATGLAEFELKGEFSKGDDTSDAMIPKQPVKVGESWTIDPNAVKELVGRVGEGADTSKSKFSAKLAKAYLKDGKQWGIIEFDFNIVVESKQAGPKAESGNVKITGTFDVVIDGSTRDGTMKGNISGTMGMLGNNMNVSGTMEKTVKTVK